MSLVSLEAVGKIYKENTGAEVKALDAIDLAFSKGEYAAVMGPSGSGKSTLLALMGAMNAPTAGRVLIDGIDVYSLRPDRQADLRREYLGFVFQRLELIPYLTALENVMLPLAITPEGGREAPALSALEMVGLDGDKARRLPSELSGGEQGRVAIARAVVNDPPVVLADEPVGSLDQKTGAQILDLLKSLADRGHTVIMVTHNPDSVAGVDRIVRLQDGRLEGIEERREKIGQATER